MTSLPSRHDEMGSVRINNASENHCVKRSPSFRAILLKGQEKPAGDGSAAKDNNDVEVVPSIADSIPPLPGRDPAIPLPLVQHVSGLLLR